MSFSQLPTSAKSDFSNTLSPFSARFRSLSSSKRTLVITLLLLLSFLPLSILYHWLLPAGARYGSSPIHDGKAGIRLAEPLVYDDRDKNVVGLLTGQMVYAVESSDVKYVVCSIPKCGSSYHVGLMLRVAGEQDYENFRVVHSGGGKQKWAVTRLGKKGILEWYANETVGKYVVVRNPMARTLSAYLNKVEVTLKEKERTVERFEKWVEEEFAPGRWDGPLKKKDFTGLHVHWRPQTLFCGFRSRSLYTPFRKLRFEDAAGIVEYLYEMMPERVVKDGWGKKANLSLREFMLRPKTRTTGADEKMIQYFRNLSVFDGLKKELKLDIKMLGYEQEVEELRREIERAIEGGKMEEEEEDVEEWFEEDE